jgi:hypothetical protein
MLKGKFIILLSLCPVLTYAQDFSSAVNVKAENYQLANNARKENLLKLYSENINPSLNLINGREYYPYYSSSTRKPVFLWGERYSSCIIINGMRYNNILLEYDTYTDDLLYIDGSRSFRSVPLRIAFNRNNVDLFEFITDNDTLEFKFFGSKNNINLKDGFYEEVYHNRSVFLIKHYSSCSINDGVSEYPYHAISYVNIGNGFAKINSIRQLCRLMGSYSSEVRKYCRKQSIPLSSKSKKQISDILDHFDKLR